MIETAEKKVISNIASSGTYFFANLATYLNALAHNLKNKNSYTYKNLFFVCPLMNGVVDQGLRVLNYEVSQIKDIKSPNS